MKTAIILFNLGGPDKLASVKPFLFNLFSDKAIIGLPQPFRFLIAKLISTRREKEAQHIYSALGGASPLLANTKTQAEALQKLLPDAKCFIAMRYWHPMSDETAKQVAEYNPDRIIYLPLYPQYSGTTTGSSFKEFDTALAKYKITAPVTRHCCYPTLPDFIDAQAALLRPLYDQIVQQTGKAPRVLFSAHGLPERTIAAGDPYQWQCEQTAKALADKLNIPSLDWRNTYQSRVGPLEWIKPYTDAEIMQAGADGVAVLIAPIAFVSEHSETLYELDQLYVDLAREHKVPMYLRSPTASVQPAFIEGLRDLLSLAPAPRHCPKTLTGCPCRTA